VVALRTRQGDRSRRWYATRSTCTTTWWTSTEPPETRGRLSGRDKRATRVGPHHRSVAATSTHTGRASSITESTASAQVRVRVTMNGGTSPLRSKGLDEAFGQQFVEQRKHVSRHLVSGHVVFTSNGFDRGSDGEAFA
jgi:hypothetical protein